MDPAVAALVAAVLAATLGARLFVEWRRGTLNFRRALPLLLWSPVILVCVLVLTWLFEEAARLNPLVVRPALPALFFGPLGGYILWVARREPPDRARSLRFAGWAAITASVAGLLACLLGIVLQLMAVT